MIDVELSRIFGSHFLVRLSYADQFDVRAMQIRLQEAFRVPMDQPGNRNSQRSTVLRRRALTITDCRERQDKRAEQKYESQVRHHASRLIEVRGDRASWREVISTVRPTLSGRSHRSFLVPSLRQRVQRPSLPRPADTRDWSAPRSHLPRSPRSEEHTSELQS